MKETLKSIIKRLAINDTTWRLLKPIVSVGFLLNHYRPKPEIHDTEFLYLFKDQTVLNGPFRGMKYPVIDAVGSQIYPKLIGSYEHELHEIIESFIGQHHSVIIDVGCAEGYYAVGLAMRIKEANVFAYDIDSKARELCAAMASLNGVSERVQIREFCDAEELTKVKPGEKGLIICDCEGYEKDLFTTENLEAMRHFDLIIEVHDFIDITISGYLQNLFAKTHTIHVIRSIDDIQKVRTYKFLGNDGLSMHEKKKLYEERRPGIMEWMICVPKS